MRKNDLSFPFQRGRGCPLSGPLGDGGQGVRPTVAGGIPTRTPWGRGPRDAPHRGRGGPYPAPLGGRPPEGLPHFWKVFHAGLPESVEEVPGPVVILIQSIHFGMGRGWGEGGDDCYILRVITHNTFDSENTAGQKYKV